MQESRYVNAQMYSKKKTTLTELAAISGNHKDINTRHSQRK